MTTPHDPYEGQPAPEHGAIPNPETPPAAQPPQQPAYYGQPPYYGPPAASPPSRGAWFAIGAASMLGLLVFAIGGFFTLVGFLLGDDYEGGEDDYYYYVDQTSVLNAVEEPCDDMRSAATEIRVFGPNKDAAADIKAVSEAITDIIDAIDANDPDGDSRQWSADWVSLQNDLDTYADNLAGQGAAAEYITSVGEDDVPIMVRMAYSSEADCEVPSVIEALDPENGEYY